LKIFKPSLLEKKGSEKQEFLKRLMAPFSGMIKKETFPGVFVYFVASGMVNR
jgi:hypothetical protein